ncbi:hypothetical protein [Prevotella sp.]
MKEVLEEKLPYVNSFGEKENDEAEVQLCGISPVFAFQVIVFILFLCCKA